MLPRPLTEVGPTATQLRARAAAAERTEREQLRGIAAQLDAEPAQLHRNDADGMKHGL
jgi:hypothetical protein